jgi:UDP-glucose 4-epimerase
VTLVTGANGFIGRHVAHSLLAAGEALLALVEPGDTWHGPVNPCVQVVTADIRDEAAIRALPEFGCAYHLAAIPRLQYNRSDDEYEAVNVGGTRNVVAAAVARRARLVHVSTIEAAGPARDEVPLHEDQEPRPENVYGRSKLESERAALARAAEIPVTVLRLPMVYGPGNMLIFSRLFRLAATGWYPRFGPYDPWMEFCNVGNAVHAMRLAMEHPAAPGRTYFVNDGRSYRVSEVVGAVARATGHAEVRFVEIPVGVALAAGGAVEMLAKLWPRPPVVMPQTRKPVYSRGTVAWTTHSTNYCTSARIQAELGYAPIMPLDAGVAEAVGWYRAQGLLR